MDAVSFFLERFGTYGKLSDESKKELKKILVPNTYNKNECLITAGQHPKIAAFVTKGLFSQYHTSEEGVVVIKRFFPEGYMCTSLSALLAGVPSEFTIKALENTTVLEYSYHAFKELTRTCADIAQAYIRYLEVHWVIEKEPLEIELRHETAKSRYLKFLHQYPLLEGRLKQHEIAAYLGITPTQLSRIRSEM